MEGGDEGGGRGEVRPEGVGGEGGDLGWCERMVGGGGGGGWGGGMRGEGAVGGGYGGRGRRGAHGFFGYQSRRTRERGDMGEVFRYHRSTGMPTRPLVPELVYNPVAARNSAKSDWA